ncbi:dephospho-CoA kinase [Aliiroseovarius subalbicans]|uniref:dephospho-CoA kinase n=1 Tax=Aliiroseovarius subalbicans TaxID=2925840 RepID=UPI001F564F1E|nr:dephospho-CoA kinase [Aliiroseovarius subalbicans]MCI2400071.1 dephospho-CoA kinase [Aliiroseovarius subalbicans]
MSDPFIIGLTGSIGMGKSTTAAMFADLGVPIWDADAAVHRIYAPGGAAVGPVGALCPDAIVEGRVDRDQLKDWMGRDDTALKQLEKIVHPLVADDRARFLEDTDAPVVLLDMPLLFEIGAADQVDLVAVVSAPADIQRRRVLERGTMNAAQFENIVAKQVPDAHKRARADVIIPTDTLDGARAAVAEVMDHVQERLTLA